MDEFRISNGGKTWDFTIAVKIINLFLSFTQVILILFLHKRENLFLPLTAISIIGLSVAFFSFFWSTEANLKIDSILIAPKKNLINTVKIASLIKYICNNGYKNRFNLRVYKSLGIEVDERQWIEAISILVRAGYATERLELTCPSCNEIIDIYIKYQDIPLDQTIKCIHCNHEFEVSEEHVIPMYSFSDNFDPMQELSMPEKYYDSLVKKD